jgi:2,4-dienoyl-CoA reductase-like NADH-dependent reductase (Old Yellow Enzyme family)/NADPH-dependent 2,4-dienoyl-CoA reductase/sulfur reductase-like enzyme
MAREGAASLNKAKRKHPVVHNSHLLSPLKIGNHVLKNRMVATNALPHFLQGPETFPNDQVIEHIAGLARNGAAVVQFADWSNPEQRVSFNPDGKRFPMYDLKDPSVHNYLCQMTEAVHFYGSKVSLALMEFGPKGYEVCDTPPIDPDFKIDMTDIGGMARVVSKLFKNDHGASKAITEEKMRETTEEIAQRCKFYQDLGFDMCSIHMSYRLTMPAQFLSPITNRRTDEYGGSMEHRARFPLAICRRIKDVCGDDFLVELQISGEEEGGTTLEETVVLAKLCESVVDILQVRAPNADLSHPIGYNSVDHAPLTLPYAAAIKESGARVLVEPIGGFQDPDDMDEYIASGKADLIGMARAFICDPHYYEKIWQGRSDDIVPCIRCNKCHVPSLSGHWVSICSVNPVMGLATRIDRMVPGPTEKLKVAVVGGGPAGMEAAIVAAERGHDVTLYEKSGSLGGQLRIADASPAKWPVRNFKNYLARQLYKRGVNVLLDTAATPALVREGNYDAVLVGVGAVSSIPDIPGADAEFVRTPISVYGDHESLGKRVVVVGGSETGTETGMYLAENGHEVVVLTRQDRLAYDATPIHYVEMVRHAWQQLKSFSFITHATTTAIDKGRVAYRDAEGIEKTIECDDIVLAGGMRPLYDEALKFHGTAGRFFMIGDCAAVGSVQTSVRTGFAAASQL